MKGKYVDHLHHTGSIIQPEGSTGIRTQVSGIRIRCDNQLHYGTLVQIDFLRISLFHGNGAQQNCSERGKNTKDTVLKKVFQGALLHIRAKPNNITALETLSAIPKSVPGGAFAYSCQT